MEASIPLSEMERRVMPIELKIHVAMEGISLVNPFDNLLAVTPIDVKIDADIRQVQ